MIDFRSTKSSADGKKVCGEVTASDRPHAGWRHFVAYIDIEKAAIAADDSPMGSDAELNNPLLRGAAYGFMHACD
ncbi:hypothetical protein [Sphingomonas sp. NFR04]|uniref:hypothetical protein n=1 Tax=Sphingomonas sp. NFR04 TaxID=1566283 RepID=UPI0011132D26|nr:hypothetical protein [Sphingomonas sp. NFR04]